LSYIELKYAVSENLIMNLVENMYRTVSHVLSYDCNIIQILTGAEVNTEKFCPKVVQCCPRAEGPRVTLHN